MSRQRLVIASLVFVMGPVSQGLADGLTRCAGAEFGHCRTGLANVADAGEVGSASLGSRARLAVRSGVTAYDFELDASSSVPTYFDRFLLDAASLGQRTAFRGGLGYGLRAADSGMVAGHGSYALSESFRVGLSAVNAGGVGAVRPDLSSVPAAFGKSLVFGFERTQWAMTLNASRQLGALHIGGQIGYLDRRDRSDIYLDGANGVPAPGAERVATLRQSFLGLGASYGIGRNLRVHGGAVFRHDESRTDFTPMALGAADRNEREWSVGLRYYGWRNFRLNMEFLKTSGRDQVANEAVLFTGRFDF